MLETPEIPKKIGVLESSENFEKTLENLEKFEKLEEFEEISLEIENPVLKSMEIENPSPDFRSFEEIVSGSVEETLILSENRGGFENPEIKMIEFENPSLEFPKSQEIISGCLEIQPYYECGVIRVKEEGENLGDSKTLDESMIVENSVVKTENNSSDCVEGGEIFCSETLDLQIGGEILGDDSYLSCENSVVNTENDGKISCGSVKIEGGESSKTLESQIGGEILGDEKALDEKTENSLSDKTLDCEIGGEIFCGSVKFEGGDCSKTLDSEIGGEILGDDMLNKTLDGLGGAEKTEGEFLGENRLNETVGGEKIGGEELGDEDDLKKTLDDLESAQQFEGEKLVEYHLNETVDDSGGERIGREELEDDELSKTLDDLGGAQIVGKTLGDDQLNKTLVSSIKDECDDVDGHGSSSDDENEYNLNRLGKCIVPYIGNMCNCVDPRCLREEAEDNWRYYPRHFCSPNYQPLHHCRKHGFGRSIPRDHYLKEQPCYWGDWDCCGDRIAAGYHHRRHGRTRNGLPPWLIDDRYYRNGGGVSSTKQYRKRFEPVPEPEPCPVGAGLANLGNTCFLNSVMQCFTHTTVLVEGLLSLKHDVMSHVIGEFCVLCAVRDQIEFSFVKSGRVISPSNLVDNLSNISSFFQKYQQEDAHEFLQALLDKLDSNWSKYEASAIDAIDSSSRSETLVQRTFGGRLVSQICCCKCGHSSETPEPLLDLSLEIEEVDSLESALESFTKVEILEDTNRFKCGGCNELVKAEKQLLLDQAPHVAALHLKRFKNDGIRIEKIDKMVKYPLELDLAPYTKGSDERNEDLKYELFAFVVHVGFSATSGHYFCYIRTSPDEWYRFDDSKVTRVSEAVALRQDAYILFYTKKETLWFSTLFDKWKEECSQKFLSTSPKSVLNVMDLPSTSSSTVIGPSVRGCDFGGKEDANAICGNSTASTSVLRQDDVEIKVGVGVDFYGPLQRDGSRYTSVVPAGEPMQDKVGPMAGVDAWDSSVEKTTSGISLDVPIWDDEGKTDEAELEDTLLIIEESDAYKHKPLGEIGPVGDRILDTSSHVKGISCCGRESDIGVEPSTPTRASTSTKLFDGEPADKATSEIPRNHLKRKNKSWSSSPAKKSCINTSKSDKERKEAARLCNSMPSRRGAMLMKLVINGKKRKQGSNFHHRQSPKKRVRVSPKGVLRSLAV